MTAKVEIGVTNLQHRMQRMASSFQKLGEKQETDDLPLFPEEINLLTPLFQLIWPPEQKTAVFSKQPICDTLLKYP